MKTTAFIFSLLASVQLYGQTRGFPASPTGLPASPANPGLPASPVNPGLPGFDNSFAPYFTNQAAGTLVRSGLNQLLFNLQADLVQILPALAAVNNSSNLLPAGGTNGLGQVTTNGVAAGGTVAASGNLSTALGNNTSANLGTSLGQDLSAIKGGRATATTLASPALGTSGIPTATVPTAIGVINGSQAGFTTGMNNLPSAGDVLRALLVLQGEVEQMLPLVNALNGGSPTNLGLPAGVVINGLGTVPLTPTGR